MRGRSPSKLNNGPLGEIVNKGKNRELKKWKGNYLKRGEGGATEKSRNVENCNYANSVGAQARSHTKFSL